MRRALLIGIDDYVDSPLEGCVFDAKKLGNALLFHLDEGRQKRNFDCRILVGPTSEKPKEIYQDEIKEHYILDTNLIKDRISELFSIESDIALLYFSGHGRKNEYGTYLATMDGSEKQPGVSMEEILRYATRALENDHPVRIREIIIILDCCYSGNFALEGNLKEGITILTATRPNKKAKSTPEGSIFTSLLCNALNGGCSDPLGLITIGSIYDYVEKGNSEWKDERMMIKMHLSKLSEIRRCPPDLNFSIGRKITELFKLDGKEDKYKFKDRGGYIINLSKELVFENEYGTEEPIKDLIDLLKLLRFRMIEIVDPIGCVNLVNAAEREGAVQLTSYGIHEANNYLIKKKNEGSSNY